MDNEYKKPKEKPMFKINEDIESLFNKAYKKTLAKTFSEISKKIIKIANN
jgi:hypothetical protein